MRPSPGSSRRLLVLASALLTVLTLGAVPAGQAAAKPGGLPLGEPGLPESRVTVPLGPGVSLTRIVRGTQPAAPEEIETTTKGPWVVHVLRIDPRRARGELRATHGPDLAGVEPTTELVRSARALAGVNASFFTFSANPAYPGDPVGLHLERGKLLSEPEADPNEVDLVLDAKSKRALIGQLRWSGELRNRRTGTVLGLEFLNHPPVVPPGCAKLADQTRCGQPGDLVEFTPEFGAATPRGHGVEVVLNRRGCVVRTAAVRGTELRGGQTSVQATGRESAALLRDTKRGCLRRDVALADERGRTLPVSRNTYGVNGRYQLTENGEIVAPSGTDSFFARNPRTIAGTRADGTVVLATIDGRQAGSVGTTLAETARTAKALGMRDAMNLDGGGSTAMSVRDLLVNQPSGSAERAVGDALVYLPR